jgi:hypothetical protein
MTESSTLQQAARVVAIVFLLVGVLGFIPGITEDAPGDFAGEESNASLFGIFKTSVLHNLVHGLFGIAGLLLARTWEGARNFLIGGGVIYIALWLLGLIGGLDWLPADDGDDWLHLGLGIGMILLGVLLRGRRPGEVAARA